MLDIADVTPMCIHDHILMSQDLLDMQGKHLLVKELDRAQPAIVEFFKHLQATKSYAGIDVLSVEIEPNNASEEYSKSDVVRQVAERYGVKVVDIKMSSLNEDLYDAPIKKSAIYNVKTREWVQRIVFEHAYSRNRLGVDYTPNESERLEIEPVPYEENAHKLAEVLTSMTDAVHQAIEL
jgi:hypothetical protein